MSRKALETVWKNKGKSIPKSEPQGQPLPDASVGHFRSDTSRSTYELCRRWETAAQQYGDKKLMQARVLGYMLYYSPTDAARAAITRSILSCNDNDEQLSELAELYQKFFIRCFRKYKGRTPTSQSHPSRHSFDVMKNVIFSKLKQAPENYSEARAHALLRDGFRDPFTGKYDYLVEQFDAVDPELLLEFGCASLQVAHIIPDSTYFRLVGAKKDYASSVLAILRQFGYDTEKLNGVKVHSLYNLITMSLDMHDAFDQLRIYLEEIGTNTYRVKKFKQTQMVPGHDIKFSTDDPEFYPVPDRELIALHAMCAKVAHMSGAGAYIEDFDRDIEDLGVFADNGGSADVLSPALAVIADFPYKHYVAVG
ncbi:hypothetical protein C8R41DRAFT_866572 [Lentinula lateritia]|uniref:HNH nuclease domain-containing protein n=1 Tax=Lentinula lateritia TaxID=40482 RepID=A0ABQ8VHX7_9AGAR|nr:hypothetical protein C8R41DRAFT_866572 [Lentinula lateritia]